MDPDEIKEEIVDNIKSEYQPITGGKRKSKRRVNPALGKWVAFVKKVQKEEKISYKEAMTRAKERKDKGEKWMNGGTMSILSPADILMSKTTQNISGGRRSRNRRTHKKRGSMKRRRSQRQMGGRSNLLRKYNN